MMEDKQTKPAKGILYVLDHRPDRPQPDLTHIARDAFDAALYAWPYPEKRTTVH